MKIRYTLLIPIVLAANALQAQQACNDRVNHTTPTHEFDLEDTNFHTARHGRTALEWQRCPLGFTLNVGQTEDLADDRCEAGDAVRFNWAEAFAATDQLNNGGGLGGNSDWRLPNVKELMSIVERKCQSPALNSLIFPAVPRREYWSSTVYWYRNDAATVQFDLGVNRRSLKDNDFSKQYVRLVRDFARP